jgi:hypothetical protein
MRDAIAKGDMKHADDMLELFYILDMEQTRGNSTGLKKKSPLPILSVSLAHARSHSLSHTLTLLSSLSLPPFPITSVV